MKLPFFILWLFIPLLSSSQNTPKQIPGTEGKETHPEARVNSPLREFLMIDAQGKQFKNENLMRNAPVVFTLFNPSCDHCEKVMTELRTNLKDFKNTNIVFLTFASNHKDLNSFIQKTEIGGYPNVHVGVAQEKFILDYFMPSYILPQMMVFNGQRKLKKIFYESLQADSVAHYMHLK